MAEKTPIDEILLSKFFKDECTLEEKQAVLDWLTDPENRLLVQAAMRRQWRAFENDHENAGIDVEKLLSKTRQRIFDEPGALIESRKIKTVERKEPVSFSFPWRAAAAWSAVIILFTSGLMLFSSRLDEPGALLPDKKAEIKSSSGEVLLKVLSDGTKVWLNAQSSISFQQRFSGHQAREVILKGEAFFDVAEDKEHPFVVKTQGIDIRVLGTAFNVKSYAGDPTIETTLVRGKVVIENKKVRGGEKIELKPNQKAVFAHSTKKITLVEVEAEKHTSWNSGSLVFEDDRLYDVIRSLERWYGVSIHMQDQSNMDCRLTARIDKESLAETLEVLRSLTGISYSITEKNVFIEGKICEQ